MSNRAERVATWALPAIALALLVPFIAGQNAWHEWSNYFWLVEQQESAIRAVGRPSYFLHGEFGVFYPYYVFYGGGLWGATGLLAIASGSAWVAFVVVLISAVAAAYGGTYWLGHQLGLDGVTAHAPALVVTTAPYFVVGNLYGRGDWAEIVATGVLPLVFAGTFDVFFGERVRRRSLFAIVAGVAVVAASHTLTLVWGSLFAGALLVVAVVVLRRLPAARLGWVVGAAALGVGLDAWFLLPGGLLSDDTRAYARASGLTFPQFSTVENVLSPVPREPGVGVPLYAQAPVYAIAWGVAVGAIAARGALLRAWTGMVALLALLLVLVIWQGAWDVLPRFLLTIQFTFRLQAYVALAAAGLVLAAALTGRARPALWAVVVVQLASAGWVALSTDPERRVARADVVPETRPESFGDDQSFGFRLLRGGPSVGKPPTILAITPDQARGEDHHFVTPEVPAGTRYHTNIVWSPLVEATGDARIAGRDPEGMAVIEIREGGLRPAAIRQASPPSIRAGVLISVLAAVGTLCLLASASPRTRRRLSYLRSR